MSKLVVLTGPSGVGKTTLANFLIQEFSLSRVVTCTTRKPREGELDGVDYNFLSKEIFQKLLSENKFSEYAKVYGNYYGVLKKDISNSLKSFNSLIILDIQGASKIKEVFKNSIVVFLSPPSEKEIFERMRKRNKDTEESLNKRIQLLKTEISWSPNADYELVNRDLKTCKTDLKMIVESFLNPLSFS
tara:strand:- start:2098 stop:2661 length:564 start_codon:yes stop_codon:yes gene_type:complete